MFGFPAEKVMGKSTAELGLHPIDEKEVEVPDSEMPVPLVLRTGTSIQPGALGFRRRNAKEPIWIHGNAVPQFDTNGNIVRVIASFADVTEMKTAERAIHQLSTQLVKLQD